MPIFQPQTDTADILKNIDDEKTAGVAWPVCAETRHCMTEHPDAHRAQVLSRKRAHALQYVGARKKRLADGYSKAASRVFTPEFISELGQVNLTRRTLRNPWLKRSMQDRRAEDGEPSSVPPFGASALAGNITSAS